MIDRRAAQDQSAVNIYRASWVGHPADEDFEILDLDTGLPVTRDTMANGTKSAAAVRPGDELRDAATEVAAAQTGKADVVPHKEEEDYEILDLP